MAPGERVRPVRTIHEAERRHKALPFRFGVVSNAGLLGYRAGARQSIGAFSLSAMRTSSWYSDGRTPGANE